MTVNLRSFARAASIVAAAALVTAGSVSIAYSRPTHDAVNIVVWQQFGAGHEKKAFDKYVALFNATHPGIHATELPVLDQTKVVASISGGKPPDVMNFGGSSYLAQYAKQGLLQSLQSYITSSHMNTNLFVPAGWDAVTYAGNHWCVPFVNFNEGLLYNVKEFQQAGITHAPSTLEELTADAAKLTIVKNGRIQQMGFLPDFQDSPPQLEVYAWDFGGDWFAGNTSTARTLPTSKR